MPKYAIVCPAVASIHKSTEMDKDIFTSCTFNGNLVVNFVLIVK